MSARVSIVARHQERSRSARGGLAELEDRSRQLDREEARRDHKPGLPVGKGRDLRRPAFDAAGEFLEEVGRDIGGKAGHFAGRGAPGGQGFLDVVRSRYRIITRDLGPGGRVEGVEGSPDVPGGPPDASDPNRKSVHPPE